MAEILTLLAWLPIGLGSYAFGWWWRGRHERHEDRTLSLPDLAGMGPPWLLGVKINREPQPYWDNRQRQNTPQGDHQ